MTENTMERASAPTLLHGWRLLGVITAVLVLMGLVILGLDPSVEGVRRVIRATARTSLVLFGASFIASATWKRFPSTWTLWQRENRRYLGLGFAVSHGIHAAAIAAFAMLDPASLERASSNGSRVSGGIAYAFIVLMSATSFDRTASWVGPRAWRILHTSGTYYIWISFVITFGKRIAVSPSYVVPVVLLLALLVIRLWGGRARIAREPRSAGLVAQEVGELGELPIQKGA